MIKFLLAFLFLFSCDGNAFYDNNIPPLTDNDLNIYDVWKQNSPLEKDSSGYYHFLYNPTGMSGSDYGTIKYTTEIPGTRIFWTSSDSFN